MSHRCFYLRTGIIAFFGGGGINFSHICLLERGTRFFVQALSVECLLHPCYFILLLRGKTSRPAFQIDTELLWQLNKRNKLCSAAFYAAFRGCLVI